MAKKPEKKPTRAPVITEEEAIECLRLIKSKVAKARFCRLFDLELGIVGGEK